MFNVVTSVRTVPLVPRSHLIVPHAAHYRLRSPPRQLLGKTRLWAASETAQEAVADLDYTALDGKEAWLVSTQKLIPIQELWTETEKCVLFFARSMGCVFCQELARQLRRDVIPELDARGVKLFLISMGPPERGIEFAELTEFPQNRLIADPENVLYDALGFYRNIQRTFFDIRIPISVFGRASRKDGGADLVEATQKWKPWLPPKSDQAFQQGGILIFDGKQCTFKHVDQATGDHYDPQKLLEIVVD